MLKYDPLLALEFINGFIKNQEYLSSWNSILSSLALQSPCYVFRNLLISLSISLFISINHQIYWRPGIVFDLGKWFWYKSQCLCNMACVRMDWSVRLTFFVSYTGDEVIELSCSAGVWNAIFELSKLLSSVTWGRRNEPINKMEEELDAFGLNSWGMTQCTASNTSTIEEHKIGQWTIVHSHWNI